VLYIDGLYGFDEPLLSSERRVRHWESSGTSKVCVVFGRWTVDVDRSVGDARAENGAGKSEGPIDSFKALQGR
jgi:hypothetical protein